MPVSVAGYASAMALNFAIAATQIFSRFREKLTSDATKKYGEGYRHEWDCQPPKELRWFMFPLGLIGLYLVYGFAVTCGAVGLGLGWHTWVLHLLGALAVAGVCWGATSYWNSVNSERKKGFEEKKEALHKWESAHIEFISGCSTIVPVASLLEPPALNAAWTQQQS